jgi:methionyl-tRNA formyltransferase
MKKMSETILFFGNERLATGVSTSAPTLRALIKSGYQIAAVVTNYEASQSRNARTLEVAEVAKEHNIPLLLPKKLLDIKDQLKAYQATAAVLVAYGRIIPEEIIALFHKGIINIHPSLLPRHRGPTPIESAILSGDSKTGVSIMQLAKEMDAGPVFAQSELPLTGNETKPLLVESLLAIGQAMISELLPDILSGAIVALPQDNAQATFDQLISKNDGIIDWHKPAVQLEREVRAYLEWPKSRTILGSTEVIITRSAIVDKTGTPGTVVAEERQLVVYSGEQALQILSLKPAGKQEMSAEAFLSGYGKTL